MSSVTDRARSAFDRRHAPLRLEIGLVNNMPDTGLRATERQFLDLLQDAAQEVTVDLKLYTLPEVPRTARGRDHLRRSYAGIETLWASRPDALIVTGAEPLAADLQDEPYWASLAKLFDWAGRNTFSTLLSCLAAHAGVLHFDGIERRPLAQKCSGLFDENANDHALTRGLGSPFKVPHSRWNALDEAALAKCGYEVLTRAEGAGVDLFVKRRDSLFVFWQGHPEYDADTLAKEYRRDVGRFLRGERGHYPLLPQGYFDAASMARLQEFEARAKACRGEALLADFPHSLAAASAGQAWHAVAVTLFRNWLAAIAAEKMRRAPRGIAAKDEARAAA